MIKLVAHEKLIHLWEENGDGFPKCPFCSKKMSDGNMDYENGDFVFSGTCIHKPRIENWNTSKQDNYLLDRIRILVDNFYATLHYTNNKIYIYRHSMNSISLPLEDNIILEDYETFTNYIKGIILFE